MDQAKPCCQNPAILSNAPSPFSKMVVLEFYDGPTSGILQCRECAAIYKFDMLDWAQDHDVRIFRLAVLPADSLTQCVKALAQPEPPRWPIWVPSRGNLRSEEARQMADREVQRILDKAQPAELVLAWAGYGETILAARKVPAADLAAVPDWFARDPSTEGPDWFTLLGLGKRQRVA
jgi:hypothetical protein